MKDQNNTVLTACDLTVRLGGRDILTGLSFSVSSGFVGLLGRNGAGKTTLIETLLCLRKAEKGKVSLRWRATGEERELFSLTGRERATLLAYAPQDSGNPPHCTVLDYVAGGLTPRLSLFAAPGEREYALAEKAAAFAGIGPLAGRYMDEISGGERRLACLARAKAQGTCWMLLDEPAAGLDFGRQHEFFAALKRYVWETGTGALVSIHDPNLAAAYCDTILVLRDGNIGAVLETGAPGFNEVYRRELTALYGEKILEHTCEWIQY